MRYLRLGVMFVVAIGSGCRKDPTSVYCPANLLPAFAVMVNDSLTGTLVPNAVVKAVGPYSDSVAVGSNLNLYPVSLGGLPGTYLLSVTAAGYSPWSQSETVMPTNSCGQPETARVSVRLRPTP